MKDYNEMASSVLKRRDEYNEKRNKTLKTLGLTLSCLCLVGAVSLSLWQGSIPEPIDTSSNIDGDVMTGGNYWVSDEWMSAKEVLEIRDDSIIYGVNVPVYVSYQGALYAGVDYVITDDTAVREKGMIWFNELYYYEAFLLENAPDHVAIVINGGFQVYQKLYEVRFDYNGTEYSIKYNGSSAERGELLIKTDDYKVYEIEGEENLLVDISTYLKRELPNLFNDDANWCEFYWIATPNSIVTTSTAP